MTATPELLRAIADLRETFTQAQLDAKAADLNAKIAVRFLFWEDPTAAIAQLNAEIAADSAALATANTAIGVAQSRAAAQVGYITDLQQQIADLQAQIAVGAPPAAALDIAERDEVNALLTELGIAIP